MDKGKRGREGYMNPLNHAERGSDIKRKNKTIYYNSNDSTGETSMQCMPLIPTLERQRQPDV